MDACPKCGGKELAIDSIDYVTVYGVIDKEETFQEQSHKFFDREHPGDGETRCVACGYATTNEKWPEATPSETVCGHQGCKLKPGHFPGHTDR